MTWSSDGSLGTLPADPKSRLHFNAQRARITPEGVRRIRPVWDRYSAMSANLLKGIPQQLLDAHVLLVPLRKAERHLMASGVASTIFARTFFS